MKSRVLWELILKIHFKENRIVRIQSYILYLKETLQTSATRTLHLTLEIEMLVSSG